MPKRYSCADCARSNLARAAAAAGKVEEAEYWLAEDAANRHDDPRPGTSSSHGGTYIRMCQWENAERAYLEACKLAGKEQDSIRYISALLGLVRARLGKGDLAGAQKLMPHIRRNSRYEGGSDLVAQLMEAEGYLAEQLKVPQAALDYFTRAAKIKEELGCYRDAAEITLHAAEMAGAQENVDTGEVLAIAARVVGMLPRASQDLYQRLAALGREPLAIAPAEEANGAQTAEIVRFLDALSALLQNDGQPLPAPEPALADPYTAILAAVARAGQEADETSAEQE